MKKIFLIGLILLLIAIIITIILVIRNNSNNDNFGNVNNDDFNKIKNIIKPGYYKFKSLVHKDSNGKDINLQEGIELINADNDVIKMYKSVNTNNINLPFAIAIQEITNNLDYSSQSFDINNSIVSSKNGNIIDVTDNSFKIEFSGNIRLTNTYHKKSIYEITKKDNGYNVKVYDDNNNLIREEEFISIKSNFGNGPP